MTGFGPENMTFPNWLVEQISNDIRTGNDAEYVESFFAARSDWQEDNKSSNQEDEQKEKAAQA